METSTEFKLYQRVLHRSNGTFIMLITKIDISKAEATCRWFSIDGKLQSDLFNLNELAIYSPKPSIRKVY